MEASQFKRYKMEIFPALLVTFIIVLAILVYQAWFEFQSPPPWKNTRRGIFYITPCVPPRPYTHSQTIVRELLSHGQYRYPPYTTSVKVCKIFLNQASESGGIPLYAPRNLLDAPTLDRYMDPRQKKPTRRSTIVLTLPAGNYPFPTFKCTRINLDAILLLEFTPSATIHPLVPLFWLPVLFKTWNINIK